MNHRPNNKAVGDLKLIFNANLCTGFTRTQLVIKKKILQKSEACRNDSGKQSAQTSKELFITDLAQYCTLLRPT